MASRIKLAWGYDPENSPVYVMHAAPENKHDSRKVQPFEDVPPIKNGDFPAIVMLVCWSIDKTRVSCEVSKIL